jgi:predicted enzyme related to lactoylglutathione lyase
MLDRDAYPAGVPCWVDLIQPDIDATLAFYGDLFGWTYEVRTPEGAPFRYVYARRDGKIVAGLGGPPQGATEPPGWTSYVSVDSVDETVAAIQANGGRVLSPPVDIPRSGRVAACLDPAGAIVGVWQPAELKGAELVNSDGSWNFSELHTADADEAQSFYGAVFGWELEAFPGGASFAGFWKLKGYADFLAERDPEIRARQEAEQAPGGFADAVAVLEPEPDAAAGTPARWTVTFAVADAQDAFARAIDLGAAAVTDLFDTEYTRQATIRDPQGAVLTISEYRPPSGS